VVVQHATKRILSGWVLINTQLPLKWSLLGPVTLGFRLGPMQLLELTALPMQHIRRQATAHSAITVPPHSLRLENPQATCLLRLQVALPATSRRGTIPMPLVSLQAMRFCTQAFHLGVFRVIPPVPVQVRLQVVLWKQVADLPHQ